MDLVIIPIFCEFLKKRLLIVSNMKEQYSQIETMVMQNNISYHENDDKKNVSSSNEKKNKIFGLPKKLFYNYTLFALSSTYK